MTLEVSQPMETTAAVNAVGRYDTTTVLEKALPVIEGTHRILANNVANANTPDFTPTHVSFRESLDRALAGAGSGLSLSMTHPRHISVGAPRPPLVLERDTFEPGRNDKSEFDIEREMVELLKNSGKFNIFSAVLTKKYQQMRDVLKVT